ncbi:MAG: 3-dehydroquinate synthase, partial [Nitrospinaceae bacterium]
MRTLRIDLKDRGYAIQLGRNLLSRLHEFLPQPFQRAVLVSNPELLRLHGAAARTGLEAGGLQVDVAVVPEGESHKTLQDAENLFDFLLRHRCDRKTLIVALGGGVIGDLAGFVAATYQRGVPYLQVPTTLLAQVDSSVGGKTAVNHPLGKNMIGAFYQPCAVVADFDTLHTLPAEEFRCGLAEVIKYGIIADPALFDYLEKNPQPILAQETASLERIIETSCAIKAQVVEQDEQEANFRMVLNFGHTLAHAVEALTGYTRFKHGEAVAIGMV